jgi:hypothetical protein
MKSGTAIGLTLAGLVLFTGGLAAAAAENPAIHRSWSLTQDGVALQDKAKRITVRLPGWHWAGAPYGYSPALAVGPQGEAIVTSDVVPVLWRIDPATLAVSVHPLALESDQGMDVGFNRLVYSREHDAFFGFSGALGSLWLIDRSLARARKLERASIQAK